MSEVMADARALLDEVRLVALRGWLDGRRVARAEGVEYSKV
ncbi:hypothetical protein [Nocardiopsis ganjiahuensis]|nr:hypothetical protein [Nocardiopsis ganjiahuensis]